MPALLGPAVDFGEPANLIRFAQIDNKVRPRCRDQIARDRVCKSRYPGERGGT
jgi:hypothetical protein